MIVTRVSDKARFREGRHEDNGVLIERQVRFFESIARAAMSDYLRTESGARVGPKMSQVRLGWVRDEEEIQIIAAELGLDRNELRPDPADAEEDASPVLRVDAAEFFDALRRSVQLHVPGILLMRACGVGWNTIGRSQPGRVVKSIKDDYRLYTSKFVRDERDFLSKFTKKDGER
jgi:hypothetical protein